MDGKLNSVSRELQTIRKQICETKKQIDNERGREHRRRNRPIFRHFVHL